MLSARHMRFLLLIIGYFGWFSTAWEAIPGDIDVPSHLPPEAQNINWQGLPGRHYIPQPFKFPCCMCITTTFQDWFPQQQLGTVDLDIQAHGFHLCTPPRELTYEEVRKETNPLPRDVGTVTLADTEEYVQSLYNQLTDPVFYHNSDEPRNFYNSATLREPFKEAIIGDEGIPDMPSETTINLSGSPMIAVEMKCITDGATIRVTPLDVGRIFQAAKVHDVILDSQDHIDLTRVVAVILKPQTEEEISKTPESGSHKLLCIIARRKGMSREKAENARKMRDIKTSGGPNPYVRIDVEKKAEWPPLKG